MTRQDERLDTSLLEHVRGLTLFRLARKRHANLSGIGAAMEPGRWNLKGQEAIYTSLNSSTTQLERFVHTPKDQIPTNLAKMTIRVTGPWSFRESWLLNSRSKATIRVFPSLRAAQEAVPALLASQSLPLGIALSSVIDPQWNVVLFPENPFFPTHVQLEKVIPFRYDARMFPTHEELRKVVAPKKK